MSDQNLKIHRAIHYFSPPCVCRLKLTVVQMTGLQREVTVSQLQRLWKAAGVAEFQLFVQCLKDWGQPLTLILDFKLSPCCEYYILSFGRFPGVWILCADVSGHIFIDLAAPSDEGARLSGVRSRRLCRLYIICIYIYTCFVLVFQYLQLQYLQ